jgi:toxin FitB
MPAARYLLDTSVFCQPLKKRPHQGAIKRWDSLGDQVFFISIVTIAEVEWGLHKLAVPRLWSLFAEILRNRLPVLPADLPVWSEFSRAKATQALLGRPVPDLDLLIAATAMAKELTVATLNPRHFGLVQGLKVEDWSDT